MEELKQTIKFLDSIQIDKYIIGSILWIEQKMIMAHFQKIILFLKDMFFNWMTSDEFADYLRKKGYRVQENISYEVWKNGINS